MHIKQLALCTLAIAGVALPSAAFADHTVGAGSSVRAGPVGVSAGAGVRTGHDERRSDDGVVVREQRMAEEAPLRSTVRVDEQYEVPLQSGCTYHATVHGTVRPVAVIRRESTSLQRLRPDLRVSSTVRCPNSTEAHIQERAVRSTGVTREEFEHLVAINGSVQRMQNSGRCMYMPDFAFTDGALRLNTVQYLCPSDRGGARGGGPYDRDADIDLRTR